MIVKTIALDSMFLLDSVDTIKIDTEGNDIKVLQGAKNLIKRSNPLLITEFWPEGITKCGYTPRNFWNLLLSYYPKIYIADEVEKTLTEGTLELTLKHCDDRKFSVNLICSKEKINVLER